MEKEVINAKAKALRAFLQARGLVLNYSASLEAVAHIEGASSYNVLQARGGRSKAVGPDKASSSNPRQGWVGLPEAPKPAAGPRLWDIEVTRLGYATRTVRVKGARSAQEAARRAEEVTDSGNFSENTSEYQLSYEPDPHPDATADITVPGDEVLGEPQVWEVLIGRISYATETLQISAVTEEQAEDRALDVAGNRNFRIDTFKYEVTAFPGPLPL